MHRVAVVLRCRWLTIAPPGPPRLRRHSLSPLPPQGNVPTPWTGKPAISILTPLFVAPC